jgi:hypothetical protein
MNQSKVLKRERLLLLTGQLEALAVTMDTSAPCNFDMTWYYDSSGCGYVACICGEHALNGDLKLFNRTLNILDDECSKSVIMGHRANNVAANLRMSSREVLNSNNLALSVISMTASIRKFNARQTDLLTTEQLKHPHINSKSSPEHAASYIRMLIEVLTNAKA